MDDGWIIDDGWMDGVMMDGCTNGIMMIDEWMDKWIDDGWSNDGQMDKWMDRLMDRVMMDG